MTLVVIAALRVKVVLSKACSIGNSTSERSKANHDLFY